MDLVCRNSGAHCDLGDLCQIWSLKCSLFHCWLFCHQSQVALGFKVRNLLRLFRLTDSQSFIHNFFGDSNYLNGDCTTISVSVRVRDELPLFQYLAYLFFLDSHTFCLYGPSVHFPPFWLKWGSCGQRNCHSLELNNSLLSLSSSLTWQVLVSGVLSIANKRHRIRFKLNLMIFINFVMCVEL